MNFSFAKNKVERQKRASDSDKWQNYYHDMWKRRYHKWVCKKVKSCDCQLCRIEGSKRKLSRKFKRNNKR